MATWSFGHKAVRKTTPFHDTSRSSRMRKVAAWIVSTAVAIALLELIGVDITGWFEDFWDSIKDIPLSYLVAGGALQIAQTTFNGVAYYGILRYAYPDGGVRLWTIVTAYAVGVSMNNFLPANIGTLVTLFMFVAIVRGATFPGVFAAYLVNKIFFTIVGALVYLYLFVEAGSAFDVELGWFRDHPLLALGLAAGAVFLLSIAARICWRWVKKLWVQAKQGGKILESPKAYAGRVLLPQTLGYAAKVGVICVFLAAYSIPVTFHSVMSVIGSSSAANMTSVTPGAVGITQAANAAALSDFTDSQTATEYSLTQQLFTTAVNAGYAVILVVLVFGWTGGRALVSDSYGDAKVKATEMKAEHARRRQEKRAGGSTPDGDAPADEPGG